MRIGFMQGRFASPETELLQSFPHRQWKNELSVAHIHNFNLMEWVIDDWNNNPLLDKNEAQVVHQFLSDCEIDVESIDAMCFMYHPFWKAHKKSDRDILIKRTFEVLEKISEHTTIKSITIPLVDNGSITNSSQQQWFCDVIKEWQCLPKILIESDMPPYDLLKMLKQMINIGITYDTGNIASMGYSPYEEISLCRSYIKNVHIKDRILFGRSKILGFGNTDFEKVFRALKDTQYEGNFILQAARPTIMNHTCMLDTYKKMVEAWYYEA